MEIKSNIEIATLHFVLILKKLGHISALRYAIEEDQAFGHVGKISHSHLAM